jgi:hypothetical protein
MQNAKRKMQKPNKAALSAVLTFALLTVDR